MHKSVIYSIIIVIVALTVGLISGFVLGESSTESVVAETTE